GGGRGGGDGGDGGGDGGRGHRRRSSAAGDELVLLAAGVGLGGLVGGLGRPPGQGEEDLVEGRAPQADVVHLDVDVVEHPHRGGDGGPAGLDRHGHPAGRGVGAGLAGPQRGQGRGQRRQVVRPAGARKGGREGVGAVPG